MSGISPLGGTSEYAPDRYEDKRENVDAIQAESKEDESQMPNVLAADQQQDKKTTMHGFQYTGKGSFIDRIF